MLVSFKVPWKQARQLWEPYSVLPVWVLLKDLSKVLSHKSGGYGLVFLKALVLILLHVQLII